jgi:acetyl esterase
MLDPQAAALLEQFAARGLPPVYTLTPVAAREAYQLRRHLTQPQPPPVHRVCEHELPAASARLRLREYQPVAPAAGRAAALLYLHGGGWTIGDLETHDVLCRSLALASGVRVFSLDYRLAPEHPFPAAFEDSCAAFAWLAGQAEFLGLDAQRLAIGGDSAGGNLAAAACLALRGAAARPAFQLLVYPATDQRAGAPSHERNGRGYLLTREAIVWYRGNYLPDAAAYLDWRASPLLAPSLAGLPPALVLTAGYDPLRDEGQEYADALSRAGVPAQLVCFERQIHGFLTMNKVLDEADTAVALCGAALRRALN